MSLFAFQCPWQVYHQMLAGNITGFAEFAQERTVNLSALEAR
jgi:hypothetical protein